MKSPAEKGSQASQDQCQRCHKAHWQESALPAKSQVQEALCHEAHWQESAAFPVKSSVQEALTRFRRTP